MLKVADGLFINVVIEEKPIPLNLLVFESVQITSNIIYFAPVGRLAITDTQGYFEKNPIGDGEKVTVFLGKTDDMSQVTQYNFRVFTVKYARGTQKTTLTIFLVYDCPKYLNESSTHSYAGTSANAIKALAVEAELKEIVTDQSSDSMKWLPMAQKRCYFARQIALHAYLDDTSCFLLGMRLNGSLHYRNIAKIVANDAKAIFMKGGGHKKDTHFVYSDKYIADTGLANSFSGYKFNINEQSPTKFTEHTTVKVSSPTNSLNVNKELNNNLSSGTTVNAPIKSKETNLHNHYITAKHQNIRIRNTYMNHIHAIIQDATALDLFDCILYFSSKLVDGSTELDKKVSGYYIVTAKTIFATGSGAYVEKFQLTRNGENYSTLDANKVAQLRGG